MKWLGLKPCWAGENRMCGVMFFRTNFSSILKEVEKSDLACRRFVLGVVCWASKWR